MMEKTLYRNAVMLGHRFKSRSSHPSFQSIEDRLKRSNQNAVRVKQDEFYQINEKNQHNRLRSLKNNNFFTAHVLPTSRPVQQPQSLVKEYGFVLPNGTCIYQFQPTTEISEFRGDQNWAQLVREYEHNGWQVLGHSGPFLVFSRLKNSRHDSLKIVKVTMRRYGTLLVALTVAIFAGGWYFERVRINRLQSALKAQEAAQNTETSAKT